MNVTPEEQANLKNIVDTERKRAAAKDPPKNQILIRINHSNDQKCRRLWRIGVHSQEKEG